MTTKNHNHNHNHNLNPSPSDTDPSDYGAAAGKGSPRPAVTTDQIIPQTIEDLPRADSPSHRVNIDRPRQRTGKVARLAKKLRDHVSIRAPQTIPACIPGPNCKTRKQAAATTHGG